MMSGHYSLDKKGISVWTDTMCLLKKKKRSARKNVILSWILSVLPMQPLTAALKYTMASV